MQQSLGGRAGFDVNGSHILSQCLLASISLIGVRLELEWLELAAGVSWDFPSAQRPSSAYEGQNLILDC